MSAKNLRINDVTERRNLTAFGTECGENFSSVTLTIEARKNCVMMTSNNDEL